MGISLRETYPAYLAGEPFAANFDLAVRNPYTGAVATRVPLADAAAIDGAIAAATDAAEPMRRLPPHHRSAALRQCAAWFDARRRELAEACCVESGKAITAAEAEVQRLIDTFALAADEALRADGGETIPMAVTPRAEGYRGMTRRVPVGPCAFITPFNFPLNLVAHKVAPAVAAGCSFVLKPADKTPVGALLVGAALAECDLPRGSWSILPARVEDAAALTEDERLRLLSFTGSDAVGWALKAKAGKKKVVLELGGNAACVVDETMARGLDDVVERLVAGAYTQSGQSCISVQRIIVHERVYDELKAKLLAKVASLPHGDPADRRTVVGPMITPGAAAGVKAKVDEAVTRGGRLLCGGALGGPNGNVMTAAVLEDVPRDAAIVRDEAFGPVAVLSRFGDFEAALAEANDSRFGLQAGVFTRDLHRALRAWDALEVGGVVINDVPGFRVDHMPYGGVKASGLGREGVRSAIEEMTEVRLMVVRDASGGPTALGE